MSYSHHAIAYREREVQAASPSRLVVFVFDHALSNLLRAQRALQAGEVEKRQVAVGKAREAISELLVTLDMEQGGEVARNLKSLYAFILGELIEVVHRPDSVRLEKLIHIVSELRGAFNTIAADAARAPAA